MARRRYVPRTYNNRRILRIVTGLVISIALLFSVSFLVLFIVLQSYVYEGELYIPWLMEEGEVMPTPRPDPTPDEAPAETAEPSPSISQDETPQSPETAGFGGDETDESDDSDFDEGDFGPVRYTTEQIQTALQPQFAASAFGERNPQVVSTQRIARDRDNIRLESAGPDAEPIDLTESTHYKVEFRFDQSIDEYNIWLENHPDEETRPFYRDGDYTVMTDYFYFFDEDGTPVLAFIRD